MQQLTNVDLTGPLSTILSYEVTFLLPPFIQDAIFSSPETSDSGIIEALV